MTNVMGGFPVFSAVALPLRLRMPAHAPIMAVGRWWPVAGDPVTGPELREAQRGREAL
jgi:hypothetical protein